MLFKLEAVQYGCHSLSHVESCTYYGVGDVGVIGRGGGLMLLDPQTSAVWILLYSDHLLFPSRSYYYSTIFEFSLYLPEFVILPSTPLWKDHTFSSNHSMDPIKDWLSPSGRGRGFTNEVLKVIGSLFIIVTFSFTSLFFVLLCSTRKTDRTGEAPLWLKYFVFLFLTNPII